MFQKGPNIIVDIMWGIPVPPRYKHTHTALMKALDAVRSINIWTRTELLLF